MFVGQFIRLALIVNLQISQNRSIDSKQCMIITVIVTYNKKSAATHPESPYVHFKNVEFLV